MKKLVRAMQDLAAADRGREEVMRRRDEAVKAAIAAGHTYKSIRDVTGMSPTTISKAIGRDR